MLPIALGKAMYVTFTLFRGVEMEGKAGFLVLELRRKTFKRRRNTCYDLSRSTLNGVVLFVEYVRVCGEILE